MSVHPICSLALHECKFTGRMTRKYMDDSSLSWCTCFVEIGNRGIWSRASFHYLNRHAKGNESIVLTCTRKLFNLFLSFFLSFPFSNFFSHRFSKSWHAKSQYCIIAGYHNRSNSLSDYIFFLCFPLLSLLFFLSFSFTYFSLRLFFALLSIASILISSFFSFFCLSFA